MTRAHVLNAQEIIDDFVDESKADFIGLWQVIGRVRSQISIEVELQQYTLDVVEMLLARGFVAINSPYKETGKSEAWLDQEPGHVIDRIRREWDALGRTPTVPDIVWFDLPSTPPA